MITGKNSDMIVGEYLQLRATAGMAAGQAANRNFDAFAFALPAFCESAAGLLGCAAHLLRPSLATR
jgi:hypothetical protein